MKMWRVKPKLFISCPTVSCLFYSQKKEEAEEGAEEGEVKVSTEI